ncbi:unnamed protein product [Brassica oleracea]|uniref:(rape) hypothetical protein n=1 Tax=Brassica napus TaxID=3708 RepID=A0A816JHW1_BRANA|nr:unnamed protein product [Brassica napus]
MILRRVHSSPHTQQPFIGLSFKKEVFPMHIFCCGLKTTQGPPAQKKLTRLFRPNFQTSRKTPKPMNWLQST